MTLVRGLSREQANDALLTLDRSGVVGHIAQDDHASNADSRLRIDIDDSAVADGVAALTASHSRALCPADKDPAPASRWIETPGEERARHAERIGERLERSLTRLPGVVEAHVHLTLPFGMGSLAENQTPPAAAVLLVRDAGAPSLGNAAIELVAGAVPGLSPTAVRVVETPLQPSAAPTPGFSRIGPVVVTRDSANTLKVWLAASLVLHILLAAALLRPLVRRRVQPNSPATTTTEPAGKPPSKA